MRASGLNTHVVSFACLDRGRSSRVRTREGRARLGSKRPTHHRRLPGRVWGSKIEMRRSTPPRRSRSASAVSRFYFDARCMFPVFCAVLCVGASSWALDRIADRLRFRRIINLRVESIAGFAGIKSVLPPTAAKKRTSPEVRVGSRLCGNSSHAMMPY